MTTVLPPLSTDRVKDLRLRRLQAGLTRLELYAHPEDHLAIKTAAKKLLAARKRKSGDSA